MNRYIFKLNKNITRKWVCMPGKEFDYMAMPPYEHWVTFEKEEYECEVLKRYSVWAIIYVPELNITTVADLSNNATLKKIPTNYNKYWAQLNE